MGLADVALLLKALSDDKLSNQERIENLEHIAQAEKQLFSRSVLAQIFNRFGFARGLMLTKCGLDQLLPIARVGGR